MLINPNMKGLASANTTGYVQIMHHLQLFQRLKLMQTVTVMVPKPIKTEGLVEK